MIKNFLRTIYQNVVREPHYSRLANALVEYRAALEMRVGHTCRRTEAEDEHKIGWKDASCKFLLEAESALKENNVDKGWQCLHAAQREEVHGYNEDEIRDRAVALRYEAKKLSGWRRDIVYELLGKVSENADGKKPGRIQVYRAAQVRDEHYNNKYFKIMLRRKNLAVLFIVLLLLVILIPVLSALQIMPAPLRDWRLVLVSELFGTLGATFSVALTLTNSSLDTKIPDQIIGSFITWMRPVIGATAAVAAYILSQAGLLENIISLDIESTPFILTIAFVSGFSERLVVNAVGKISGDENKPSESKQ